MASVFPASFAGRRRALIFVALVFGCGAAGADVEVVTPDGRRVLLRDDQTWTYVDAEKAPERAAAAAPAQAAPLTLESMKESGLGCVFGLKLVNTLGFEIKSIVPQFTAMAAGGISYQTVFQSFNSLKPTASQYQEIEFRGIDCGRIESLEVSGGDRCTMGELTKFFGEKGQCLAYIDVRKSNILPFSK